ncbi:MAG: chemotaxis protein CheW [Magnetococcales bacterium]|nr:chemotaxis protein CheW [Magnetococcales bacterium]
MAPPEFPSTLAERAVLQQRALHLAQAPASGEETGLAGEPLLHFRPDADEEYAIAYRFLEEILPMTPVSPVPYAPQAILGVINRLGQLLPVVDLCRLLFRRESALHEDGRILVVRGAGMTVGIPVAEVLGKVIHRSSPRGRIDEVIEGLHEERIMVLNVDALLSHPTLQGR